MEGQWRGDANNMRYHEWSKVSDENALQIHSASGGSG